MSNLANYEVLKEWKPERAFLPEYLTKEISNQILKDLKTLNPTDDISVFVDFEIDITNWENQCHCCHSNYDNSHEWHIDNILTCDKSGYPFSIVEWISESINESTDCKQYTFKSDINLKRIQILKY